MPRMNEEIRRCIGMETELQLACDPVEKGAVRRYAQAIMDIDPIYMGEEVSAGGRASGAEGGGTGAAGTGAASGAATTRYGAPVAPPLFPNAMLRLSFGDRDLVQERAEDPDFDGAVGSSTLGLPPLPLVNSPLLNGGTEVELFRYARHGEQIWLKSRYLDIYERETSKGWMLMVLIETDFLDKDGQLVMRFRKTQLRR